MKTMTLGVLAALTLATMGCNLQTTPGPDPDPGKPAGVSGKLVKFASQAELNAYIEKVSEASKSSDASDGDSGEGDVMASAPEASSAEDSSSGDNAEITNNQEAGVDEGGIVKNYKDLLIVLREGHLYTVRISDTLKKLSETAVAAEGLNTNVWYDEILVDGSKVIVIGYRYSILPAEGTWYKNSATEINLFDLSDDGELTRGDTYFIESGDYYSWTNYSGRMINGKFALYMPYDTDYLWEEGQDVRMPAWYKYVDGALVSQGHFFEANQVVKPVQDTTWPTFHVVAVCSLEDGLACRSDVVLGSWNRTYYVSQDAAYLFLSQYYGYWLCGAVAEDIAALSAGSGEDEEQETNLLYRLSLDGASSGAVGIEGDPFDQFSLVEKDNQVSVFISAYHPSTGAGRTYSYDQALVRIPMTDFSDEVASLPAERYLLMPDHDIYKVRFHQNRLVYAGSSHVGIVDMTSGNISTLASPFYVTRMEPAGERVVIFGSDDWGWGDSLSMASVSLGIDGLSPILGEEHAIPLYQGEWRSHGYAFHDGETTDHFGLATLEIREKEESEKDYYWDWYEYIPSVSFFTLSPDGAITDAGRMTENEDLKSDNACTTSCVDWYGNTRPIFLEDHVIGLMGDQMAIGAWSEAGEAEVAGALNFTSGF